jgi:AcrR family transcriptional regulator
MSPRVEPEERRREILDAAVRCFARGGYHGTSMDDIVAESGLSKGTLYWHFKSKRDLFIELFDRIMAEMVEPLEALIDMDAPPVERLRLMASAGEQFLEQGQDLLTMPLHFVIEIWQDEDFIGHYMEIMEKFAIQVKALLQEGIDSGDFRDIDTEAAAWGIMALVDGIFLYRMAGMPGDVSRELSTMVELLIEGLLKRDGE